jgi:hypothetical protein
VGCRRRLPKPSAVSPPGEPPREYLRPRGFAAFVYCPGGMLSFYATYRLRRASTYGSAAAGRGGGQRQSVTASDTNPTKVMGTVGFPCGTGPSWKCQVFSPELAPVASNSLLAHGIVQNKAKLG